MSRQKHKLIVEWGSRCLKLVQFKHPRGVPILSFCEIIQLPEDEKQQATELSRTLSEKDIHAKEVVAVISRKNVVMRQLMLPVQTDEDLCKAISLQVSQLGPFSSDEMICRFSVLERQDSGQTRVLVTVVPQDEIKRQLRLVQSAGKTHERITLSSYGLLKWFCFQQRIKKKESDKNVMLFALGCPTSEICFVSSGRLIFSVSIPFGVEDLERGDSALLKESIEMTLDAYQKENWGDPISRGVIIATQDLGLDIQKNIRPYFSAPVEVIDPLEGMARDESILSKAGLKAQGSSFAALAGFAVDDGKEGIDLIPHEIKEQRLRAFQRGKVLRTAVLAAFFLVLAAAKGSSDISKKENILLQVKRRLMKSEQLVLALEEKAVIVKEFDEERGRKIILAEVVQEIYRLTPQEITFKALDIQKGQLVEIKGYAKEQGTVNEFQKQLMSSSLFKNVMVQQSAIRKRAQDEFVLFRISCQIEGRGQGHAG